MIISYGKKYTKRKSTVRECVRLYVIVLTITECQSFLHPCIFGSNS